MLSDKGCSELLWALLGPMVCEGLGVWGGCRRLIRVWCGKATRCGGATLVDVLWKGPGLGPDELWKA